MSRGLVHGVGVYEKGDRFFSGTSPFQTREYRAWIAMLRRCYSKTLSKSTSSKYTSYRDCTVSENFKNFQYFAEWCQHQIGFNKVGYSLDKDIIKVGNREYGEDSCVFVPEEINNFVLTLKKVRGAYPVGVYLDKRVGKFVARVSDLKEVKWLGSFSTPEEAFQAYKIAKENRAKELAIKYEGVVDDRVTTALNNYTITIDD